MEPRDVPRVLELCAEQNRRDGTSYPLPPVFDADGRRDPNAALALVTEMDGEVRQGHIFLRTLEMMSFGVSRRASAISLRHAPLAVELLRERGYVDMHVLAPRQRAAAMENRLAQAMGLLRDDDRLAHFYRQF